MDLKAYLYILWGNKWIIFTTVLVTVIGVTVFTLLTTPIYSAAATLRVAAASLGSVSYTDYMYADRLMNTYTRIGTSKPVLDELKETLGIQTLPEIKISTIPSTELIQVTVKSSSPEIAQTAANALAEILVAQSKNLYSGGGKSSHEILNEQLVQVESELATLREDLDALMDDPDADTEAVTRTNDAIKLKENTYSTLLDQYEQARLRDIFRENIVTVVEPAGFPVSPSSPRKLLNISLGLLIGFVGGVGLVFLLENFNSRLYTTDQVEFISDLKPIGKIRYFKKSNLLSATNGNSKINYTIFRESFRRLQVSIASQNFDESQEGALKTLLFTSALPGEGKSIIVKNLGVAYAQSGLTTLIVDCDMRIPTQHKMFGVTNRLGLSTVLNQQIKHTDVIRKTGLSGLYLLTSGPVPTNPTKLLGSSHMKDLVEQLQKKFDIVIFDAPALLSVADTLTIARLVDGVALVTRLAYSKVESVEEACRQLNEIQAHMIGVVINNAEENGTYYYHAE